MRRLLLALSVLIAATPAFAQTTTPSEMLRSSVHNVIRPAIKTLSLRADELVADMEALCRAPAPAQLEAARAGFAGAALAFGRVEFVRTGPLVEENRVDRLLFWPDRKGIALKQVQAILAGEDAAAITPERIRQGSVAVQGFGALEFVLFGTGAETLATGMPFRCAFGQAIAANIATIAGELVAGWADPDGIALHLTAPDPAYADYRTQTEALEGLVGLMAHGIEAARDQRLLPFISRDGKPAKPRQAMFWRSSLTLPMLRADIEGIRRMLGLSGIVSDADLASAIEAAFGNALAAIDRVTGDVETAVVDPDQAAALLDLLAATQDLQRLIGEELSASLGLSVGFSSLDGD
ncbi:imelysin family protein [Devosia sp.]|uniref:imelysin family protein n=1 Tax=Devosia sp. TaxID=1871048 RepID=UPI002AFE6750|nr:imelysin family protein [Devosia sp.]